jgi:sugar phosphate isomerase/epimerase
LWRKLIFWPLVNNISRRNFTIAGLAAAGAARFAPHLQATPLGLPIGCQTWPVRQTIGKDFEGTLKSLAAAGFQNIEMCSPPDYKDLGFGPLMGMPAAEMREKIQAAGLHCESCHYPFSGLKPHLDERMAFAKELGLKQMIISTFWLPKDAQISDYLKAADEANKLGERTRAAGIQLGFHNHDFEFHKIAGDLIYDKLMGEFDPKLIKMQFQVDVISLGYQAADYFEKYPGRFISMHLQDWSPEQKKDVVLGTGVVDWNKLFAAAKKTGVKNYFVELEGDDLKASVPFLRKFN